MTIKAILDSLKPEQKRQLLYAFEHEMTQHVPLDGGKYIGVNTGKIKFLIPEENAGVWSYGTIKSLDRKVD